MLKCAGRGGNGVHMYNDENPRCSAEEIIQSNAAVLLLGARYSSRPVDRG